MTLMENFPYLSAMTFLPMLGALMIFFIPRITQQAARSIALVTALGSLVISVIWSWDTVNTRVREYYIAILLLETGMLGVFVSLDMFLFYIFWELMLIPMALLIGIWGSTNRVYASVKFFLYTLFGSLLMLVG